MVTVEYETCWCGNPGLLEHCNNFLGMKGKVAYVLYCSRRHKEMFDEYGDMIVLFGSNKFMLKENTLRVTQKQSESAFDYF